MEASRDVLRTHQAVVNRLNVYPVPDGDTGTNMALTLEAVVGELERLGPGAPMADVCKAVAHGSLMGARGNSGVILSQLLRGLADRLGPLEAVGAADLAAALVLASDLAHQAVVRPVEGTILSVARAAGEGASGAAARGDGLAATVECCRAAAATALARTPEQLDVLARAGVVDAGGTGYLLLLDALLHVVDGRPLPEAPVEPATFPMAAPAGWTSAADSGLAELRFEVMYLLEAPDDTIADFKEVWAGLGDSIVVVGGEGLWNCHIHTNDIGPAIEAGLDAGRPREIRVTDLAEQVEEERWVRQGAEGQPEAPGPPGPAPTTAVVAVVSGAGVGRIFRSLGVHGQVVGGQSMNPSTADILAAVEDQGSAQVVVLPNNKNIRPVAEQVDELTERTVRVVPTGSIVEGFAALMAYDPAAGADANAEAMTASAGRVLAAEVTRAVRDATTEAGPVRAGDWIGLTGDGVVSVADTVFGATCGLLERTLTDRHELVTLIEGEGATAGDTRRIRDWLDEVHPEVALEVHHGGQPLYPYLLGIE
jgi:DAK2 domain fusion protein YloV